MSPPPVHVFISSTWLDLQPEREKVEAALQRMRETKFAGMEYFGSRDEDTRSTSLAEVDRSRVYVGIFGGRYGSGITEAEYRRARERKLPCFIYVKDEGCITADKREADADKTRRLRGLKDELHQSHTITIFDNPDDLAAKVTADLHRWLFDEYLTPRLESAARGQFPHGDAQSLLSEVKAPGELDPGLLDRLRKSGFVLAQGPGSVAIGGGVSGGTISTVGTQHIYYQLQAPYSQRPPLEVPFQVPPLPAHFVPRPVESRDLKARLLADGPTAGSLVVSAVHGLGGVGKSTLAADLAYDSEVRERFPDGVLWATLGQQPNLLSLLSGWVQALGDYNFKPLGTEPIGAFTSHLRILLHDKAALLVVDDAWDPAQVSPFLVGGPRCQVLITTRRANVADELGADLFQLGVMTPAESLALLAARLKRDLGREERDDALLLAEAVGFLPLALELAAARVSRGVLWTELRNALEAETARLEELEEPRQRRTGRARLKASLSLSLRTLWAEDRPAYEAFVWLGVLPEDAVIAAPMATTFWGVGNVESAEMLELLWSEALLLPSPPFRLGDRMWHAYRLHDLLHDLARHLLTAPSRPDRPDDLSGLGLTMCAAHAALLERYWAQTQGGLWHTLTDDGYIYIHLTWHLEQAGQEDKLHALMREETAEGRNGWYGARERLGQVAGFLSDADRAWRLAEQAYDSRQSSSAIGLQCCYALMITSLRSLAENIAPGLLSALVEKGIWLGLQGLAYARHVQDDEQRAEALAALAPYLDLADRDQALREALEAAQAMERVWARPRALAALAPRLAELSHPAEALEAAQAIKYEWPRSQMLVALAPRLTESLLPKAWEVAQTIGETNYRSRALAALAPHLTEPLLHEALKAARAIENERARSQTLAALASRLGPTEQDQVLREALSVARAIEGEWDQERSDALVTLAPLLTEPLLREALDVARAIYDGFRSQVLVTLAPRLSEPLLREALEAARTIKDESSQSRALAALASYLGPTEQDQVLREALEAARTIRDDILRSSRSGALAALAPRLSEPLLREALEAVRTIRDDFLRSSRSGALAALAPRLAELGHPAEALELAQAIPDKRYRYQALAALASYLTAPMLRAALEAARAIGDEGARGQALAALAPRLAELGRPAEALEAARAIRDEGDRSGTLAALAPHLGPTEREQALRAALEAARAIKDESSQSRALAALASHLGPTEQDKVLREALSVAQDIKTWDWSRSHALYMLAPYLTEPLLREALEVARAIGDKEARPQALAALASRLAERGDPSGALSVAQDIQDEYWRSQTLAALAPHLAPAEQDQVLREALPVAQAIQHETSRWQALATLAPRLAELGHPAEALEVAQAIQDKERRSSALAALVPHLAPAEQDQVLRDALSVAQDIQDEESRSLALAAVVPHLAPAEQDQVLREALSAAWKTIESEYGGGRALPALAPRLAELPPAALHPLWSKTIHVSATRRRARLLQDLRALHPVLAALGGSEARAYAPLFRAYASQ
jgi:NTP pyrophosphatase (non-canonical NTP hydrolase)